MCVWCVEVDEEPMYCDLLQHLAAIMKFELWFTKGFICLIDMALISDDAILII